MARGNLFRLLKTASGLLSTLTSAPSSSSAQSPPTYLPEQELMSLKRTMLRIQAELADAEEREIRDASVKLRLRELKDVAYDAEDVVDLYDYEVLRAKIECKSMTSNNGCPKGKQVEVCDHSTTTTTTSHVPLPNYLADKVKEIRTRFDEIISDWEALHLEQGYGKRRRVNKFKRQPTSSLVDESEILGREEEKENLVELLLMNDDDDTNCSRRGTTMKVIPVIGMGGIGKTTLAQLVYNDPRVSENFEMRGWVCVSEDFDVVGLTRKILMSFTRGNTDHQTELNDLQESLRKELQGKKFLLVMDDVWNENASYWELLKQPLARAGVGRVIVTTRSQSIARFMQTVEPVNLNILSLDFCWMLFNKLAFDGLEPNNVQENLVEIGREIVKKCKGLPLAVKVLGSALRYEDDENSWMDILESELWEQEEGITGQILPALKISYDCMPTELKRCFKYLSLFPKDTRMEKQKIVHLWMSQGLLEASSNKQAEDIGYDYLKSLVQRSIMQIAYDDDVIMHDLMIDLARSIASGECVTIEADKKFEMFEKVRNLWVDAKCMEQIDRMPLGKQQYLRTIFIEADWYFECNTVYTESVVNKWLENLKCIRALDLSYTNIDELPDSIGNLKLLRYLSIEGTPVESLPDSMCSLYNLQTLNITQCEFLVELPRWIINLSNLRHIFTDDFVYLPRGIGQLTNLQTLKFLCLGNSNSYCELADLNGLQNLRGRLTIYVEEDFVISGSETPLKTIHGLIELDLRLNDLNNADIAERLLECLQPHANLKNLSIGGYSDVRFAKWVSDPSFSKLAYITLSNCGNCEVLPPLGQLPSLETLNLFGMDGVQHVGQEFCANDSALKGLFPSLISLSFNRMRNWEVWDGVKVGDFPNLLKLEIYCCGKLREFPGCLIFSLKELILVNLIALPALHSPTSSSDHDLPSFPLERLEIWNCSNLRFASGLMNKFTPLHHLEIRECPHLQISLMERLPSKPTTVSISGSPWVEEWYHQHTFGLDICDPPI